jgi:4-hydroxy-tetrahydrodipicolinate reductase
MKIALIGYGKMGKEIEQVAIGLQHEIVLKIGNKNTDEFTSENLKKADVAIEFTTPQSAPGNILKCINAGVPVVCGTTGWFDKMEEVKTICIEKNQSFFYASNFSIGMNLFSRLNVYLARLMKNQSAYYPAIEEVHHIHKKDAPSGSAIALAEGIMKENDRIKKWVMDGEPKEGELPIESIRVGQVPGTHTVYYTSEADEIKISHEAYSRKGFAEGAVHAAEWLIGKKGVFGMGEMLREEVISFMFHLP